MILYGQTPLARGGVKWEYIGRHHTHHTQVVGLSFGEAPSGVTKLYSLGEWQ